MQRVAEYSVHIYSTTNVCVRVCTVSVADQQLTQCGTSYCTGSPTCVSL